jgi:hypothetical protein
VGTEKDTPAPDTEADLLYSAEPPSAIAGHARPQGEARRPNGRLQDGKYARGREKTGVRQRGTPNKATREKRLLEEELADIESDEMPLDYMLRICAVAQPILPGAMRRPDRRRNTATRSCRLLRTNWFLGLRKVEGLNRSHMSKCSTTGAQLAHALSAGHCLLTNWRPAA